MTFGTLAERLRRLKSLAEVVGADAHAEKLTALLNELETRTCTHETEVTPALLSDFHHRLLDRPDKAVRS